jgi:pimeloyl-ACP methyl ester carboxylesterase
VLEVLTHGLQLRVSDLRKLPRASGADVRCLGQGTDLWDMRPVIAYETFGRPDEAPLLLISGTGAQMLIWPEDFCTALAGRGFQVARFDNRDTGLSTHLTGTPAPGWLKAMLRRPPRRTGWRRR